MNESTLITFHCYQGDKAQVEFLLPEARKHGCHIVVFSPEDSKVIIPGVECRHAGKRAYIGQDSLDRQRYHLSMILEYPHQFYLMNDADSCCLSPEIPRYLYDHSDKTIWSNEVPELRPHLTPGLPKMAMQPPYFTTRGTLYSFLTAPIVPAHPITPYIDWWMMAQTYSAGLKHRNFQELEQTPPVNVAWLDSIPDFGYKFRLRESWMWHAIKSSGQLALGVGSLPAICFVGEKSHTMKPRTLVAVAAYVGDLNQVENNLPYYLHHGCTTVVLSPDDAPITRVSDPSVHCWWGGQKGWIGPHTLERQRLHMARLLEFDFDFYLFNDADSLCVSPGIPSYLYSYPDIIWSNEVTDTNPAPSMLPKLALQPPYFFSRAGLSAMLRASMNLPCSYFTRQNPMDWPLPFPTECIDHWMLQVAEGAGRFGLTHSTFRDGVSFNTKTPEEIEAMALWVRAGKNMLHSVKTKESLDRMVKEYRAR